MGNEQRINKHNASDLAIERHRANVKIPGVKYEKSNSSGYTWERLQIESEEGAKSIGRPMGRYSTLTLPRMDMLYEDEIYDAANEIAAELCNITEALGKDPARLLIVGLGNPRLTPDSVGPKTAGLVNATMHISEYDKRMFGELECSEIAVISPDVMGRSGIDSFDTVSALAHKIEPNLIIAIDSLASRSAERLGTSIQICDTGIRPGSGIGGRNSIIDKEHIGIPVIAIGVPTVINSALLFSDEEDETKKDFLGEGAMYVSPREIDTIVETASRVISHGINQAFGIT